MPEHTFSGFGFGPIQAGLFAKEAFQSGNFARIVAAEIDQAIVDAVRANGGCYSVNVARADGIEVLEIEGVELLNPNVTEDRQSLLEALSRSTEICTCLPSVSFYDSGDAYSAASLIAEGLRDSRARATIIYTAENNNRAAEILEGGVVGKGGAPARDGVQFLNTVIGKMSRVVSDPGEISGLRLRTVTGGIERAFLVEEFNRILVSKTRIAGFEPGIRVFIEKENLLPFEEAKLYGHNAVHSLLGFLGMVMGYTRMTELRDDLAVMEIGREAFLHECGRALVSKHGSIGDELFSERGFRRYAEDLLERMTNPYLADTPARAGRDVVRKLGLDERIFGTMQMAMEYGIEPENMALGAAAGIAVLLERASEYGLAAQVNFGDWRRLDDAKIESLLDWLWHGRESRYVGKIIGYVRDAIRRLEAMAR